MEGGEHADAVDNAAANLETLDRGSNAFSQLPANQEAAKLTQREIKLGNGMTVSAGDISALMGDFYGVYTKGQDGKDHFDPAASFEAMNNGNKAEMKLLLSLIHREKDSVQDVKAGTGEFEATNNSLFEMITSTREFVSDDKGTRGLSFLELADRNTNHFNTESDTNRDGTVNTDSNAGAYRSFHEMALHAAQAAAALPAGSKERDEAENRALALEASSQHFLVDRFAGGHQFDKQRMMDENGGGNDARLRVRAMHNELNESGTTVRDDKGHEWTAKGDSHWGDATNMENRGRAAKATLDSYGDIDSILSSKKSFADFQADPMASTRHQIPRWSLEADNRIQERAKQPHFLPLAVKNAGDVSAVIPGAYVRSRENARHAKEGTKTPAAPPKTGTPAEQVPIDTVTFPPDEMRPTTKDHLDAHGHYTDGGFTFDGSEIEPLHVGQVQMAPEVFDANGFDFTGDEIAPLQVPAPRHAPSRQPISR